MKKTNVSISMWESLKILGQWDLLQAAMENWSASNELSRNQEKVLTNVAPKEGVHGGQK
ncbi:hypothetical protein KI387_032847, partial [Taxus chinensis]